MSCASFFAAIAAGLRSFETSSFAFSSDMFLAFSSAELTQS
jgi:hypothetical protein